MDPSLSALLELAKLASGDKHRHAGHLAASLLPPPPWLSTLNNDGSPLQVCIGLGASPRASVRLLVDPAAHAASGGERRLAVQHALGALLASHAPGLRSHCHTLLTAMLPADEDGRAALPGGGAWLAANLDGTGMALYVTAKWGAPAARWARARAWMETLSPGSCAGPVLARLAPRAALVSAGIEGADPARARLKLYWRLTGPAALKDLGLDLLDRREIADFLHLVVADRKITRGAVVGSVSFDLASGAQADVKLDVCGHCVPRPWAEWLALLRRGSQRFGLAPWPIEAQDSQRRAEVAFVGFGLDRALTPRLNVYLKRLADERPRAPPSH